MNRKKIAGCSSKYKGVSWNKHYKKWRATIRVNGKTLSLGFFENEWEAAKAYNDAALKYFGSFSRLNIYE